MDEMIKYAEVIASVVVASAIFIYTLKKKIKDSGIRIWESVFKGSEEIDNLLNEFAKDYDGVDMVSLMLCENGGGIPSPTSRLRTSIISDGQVKEMASYKDNWQHVPADYQYKAMLKECFLNGYYLVTDAYDLEDSIVKNASLSIGVKSFRLEHLLTKEKAWYYLVLSSTDGIVPYDYTTNDSLRVLKQELIDIIND